MSEQRLHPIYDYVAGGLAGLTGLVIGHPLDTAKIVQQLSHTNHDGTSPTSSSSRNSIGLRSTLKLLNNEGIARGHFSGLLSPLFSYAGLNAVYFGIYGNILTRLRTDQSTGATLEIKDDYHNIFFAGCAGGAVQTIPGCPFELAKVIVQSQVGARPVCAYRGPWHACMDIIRKRGISGIYRGFVVHNVRDIPAFGIYIVSFEYLNNNGTRLYPSLNGSFVTYISGGIAGILSWITTMPFDVVKNRFQADCHGTQYKHSWQCATASYREGGLRIFFRGWYAVCLRAFLVNGVTLMVYSHLLDVLHKR